MGCGSLGLIRKIEESNEGLNMSVNNVTIERFTFTLAESELDDEEEVALVQRKAVQERCYCAKCVYWGGMIFASSSTSSSTNNTSTINTSTSTK